LSMTDAIRKMTGLAAEHLGIADRGKVVPGAFADLVLFDPETISDRATYEQPTLPAVGIERVWVNGVEVYRDGKTTGAHPGQIISRQQEILSGSALQKPVE
jgi:N-acyl-D-amino-acid deacylase